MPKKRHAPAPQKQKTPEVVEKPEEAGNGAAATTATGSSPAAAPADVDLELGELPEAARKAFAELNLKIDNIVKIKASSEDDYLRSTDQPRQWEAGRARARRSGAWCCAGSGAEFTSGTLESPVAGQPVLNLSKYKNVRSLLTL